MSLVSYLAQLHSKYLSVACKSHRPDNDSPVCVWNSPTDHRDHQERVPRPLFQPRQQRAKSFRWPNPTQHPHAAAVSSSATDSSSATGKGIHQTLGLWQRCPRVTASNFSADCRDTRQWILVPPCEDGPPLPVGRPNLAPKPVSVATVGMAFEGPEPLLSLCEPAVIDTF